MEAAGVRSPRRIAGEMNLAIYDNDIMHFAEQAIGLTDSVVENSEKKITNRFLYDMVAQVYHQSEQKCLQDKLYAAENDVIKRFAEEGNCVIVGRCADVTCRNFPNTCHIFLSPDEKRKVQEIMKRENVPEKAAHRYVREINKKRADHYKYYTSGTWGMAGNLLILL